MTLLLASLALVSCLRSQSSGPELGEMIVGGSCAVVTTAFCLTRCGAYRIIELSARRFHAELQFGAVSVGVLLFIACLQLLRLPRSDALLANSIWSATWGTIALALLLGARGIWLRLFSAWTANGALDRRIAIVGINQFAKTFVDRIVADRGSHMRIVGIYTDGAPEEAAAGLDENSVDGNVEDLVARCRRDHVDAIVIAAPLSDVSRIERLCHALRSVTADIYVTTDLMGLRFSSDEVRLLGRNPVASLRRRPLDDWQQLQKALFDRVLGGMLLFVLSPMLLLIAIAIRFDSPGPVLFKQPRLGFNNRTFTVYKFRTMFHHADTASLSGDRQARRDDPRITRIGKWLRKTSVDELPQLLNVMKGEMSLVGPRPHPLNTRAEGKLFDDVVADYSVRHRVLPGITGWAQVNGWRGETVILEQIEQRVAHDLYYIDNWSLIFDIKIMVLTIAREIISRSAF